MTFEIISVYNVADVAKKTINDRFLSFVFEAIKFINEYIENMILLVQWAFISGNKFLKVILFKGLRTLATHFYKIITKTEYKLIQEITIDI